MGRRKRTTERNRKIIAGFRRGKSRKELAERYDLTVPSITQIINMEREREVHSPDAYYESLRVSAWSEEPGEFS